MIAWPIDLLLRVTRRNPTMGYRPVTAFEVARRIRLRGRRQGAPSRRMRSPLFRGDSPGTSRPRTWRPWSAQSDALAPCLVVGPATLRSRGPRSRSCLVARSNRPHHQPSHRRGWTVPSPPLPLVVRGRPLSTGVVVNNTCCNILNNPLADIQYSH